MKITYKGDYALKALFQLALRHDAFDSGVMSINELAKAGDMPEKFLEQILLSLGKGSFVKSKRGVKGGFVLARPPKDITVGEVIKFIEGPISPISCIEEDNYRGCKDVTSCIFRGVWKDVKNAISVVIDTLTFEELVLKHRERMVGIVPEHDYAI